MQNPIVIAARAVMADFLPAEHSTDLAAAQTARLLATVLEQRSATNIAIGTGASLIRKLSRSLAAQIEAREEFIMAHKIAASLPAELGLDPSMYGDVVACPPDDARVVGDLGNGTGSVVRLVAA